MKTAYSKRRQRWMTGMIVAAMLSVAVVVQARINVVTLPERDSVQLTIYNLLGQHIRTLVNQQHLAGNYQLTWDGRDEAGNTTAAGVYIYQLRTPNRQFTRRMMKLE